MYTLYERLWYADRDGLVEIGVDLRYLNRKNAPTFSAADNALPFVATICCMTTAWMLGGWVWGLAILGSGIILSLTSLNLWVMHRLRERTLALARSGEGGWLTLWEFGGLSLRLPGQPETEVNAPAGDWQAFVARHLPAAPDD